MNYTDEYECYRECYLMDEDCWILSVIWSFDDAN